MPSPLAPPLGDVRCDVFNGVATEPTLASVEAAVDMVRERSCDLIIGLGGGSSMDSAKAVSLLIGNGGKFRDYTQRREGTTWKPGRPIEKKGLRGLSGVLTRCSRF